MSDFIAVLVDLYHFLRDSLSPRRAAQVPERESHLSPTVTGLLESQKKNAALPPPERPVALPPLGMSVDAYVVCERASVYLRPLAAFDSVLAQLSYATKVAVSGYQGRFAHVTGSFGEGWILKDEVVTDREAIWPKLIPGKVYLAEDVETVRVRAVLKDEFSASVLFLPLCTEEYVTYRLSMVGRRISWGSVRPRQAGVWHELLKGRGGVFMSLEPKTGSVMEATLPSGESFLAFVTAVLPDNTVHYEAVGQYREGEYTEGSVSKAEWLPWHPVFIQVT